ncbi:MAG TPA: GC-type dockerin domain-anchored protein, partial [Phycisphaerales bacterium]|nr:GC-type dockerin domain-anchored protein [Phycisphaerales bacterium]
YAPAIAAAALAAAPAIAAAQGSYSTNVGAFFWYPGSPQSFTAGVQSSQFPLLGVSRCSSTSSRATCSGSEGFFASVDRGLIEHSSQGSGSRGEFTALPGRYEGLVFGGSGSSGASWNDVVVSYVGGDVGSDIIAVSAQFSVVASTSSSGVSVTPVGYNVSASASIAGSSGQSSVYVQNSGGSTAVSIPPVFVTVNQPFAVSMGLNTSRTPSGTGFGGQFESSPGSVTWSMNASIATNGPGFTETPVFNVPEGYTVNSPSMGVVNNRWIGRTIFPPCGPADIGATGGLDAPDGRLDNNDFVVFIDRFFAQVPSADVGSTGGVAGIDGAWDNNDFVVFIDRFFAGCV